LVAISSALVKAIKENVKKNDKALKKVTLITERIDGSAVSGYGAQSIVEPWRT
jgi:hypothetical protein